MPISKRFKELRSRLIELKTHMLPGSFSATGNYTDRQLDRTRGYRLLVHAEIESYLEDVSKEIVTDAIREWKRNGKASNLLIAFLASYHSSWSVNDECSNEEIIQLARSRKKPNDSIEEVIDLAQKQFVQIVKDNHGVKENNFKSLILPTGIDIAGLDNTWMTTLDNFGSLRGEIAHKTKRATTQLNPEDEYKRVKDLLEGLKDLDKKIMNIKSELI
ncbi:HEPN domain-containing protein [Sulfurimonas sp. HSL1-2]|uniref:HEPN domain-containing protein n=1 Tax=Thiomicrolovo zhangzhouensis TaxID=3131933 RepID=UPI0031F9D5DB